ncbi:unnamed protein product [Chrysoparadoxa australica]
MRITFQLLALAGVTLNLAEGFAMSPGFLKHFTRVSSRATLGNNLLSFRGGAAASNVRCQPDNWFSMTATSGAIASTKKARPSATHPSFAIVAEDYIPEYEATTTLYRHKKSGAQLLSVQIEDDNKVFGISFRTPPEDSSGIAHVLEHSVLCGSRKFPLKEPFADLLKGSLQTFLNAFTYPDRTCYPVASQNTKDFYNLVNVYLDAVLFPRATKDPLVLQQEGWHYELENVEDALTYKGVVFNEMKGVYSSPDSLMGRACQQALFPANAYAVDSGGDPVDIPNLTFDYFKGFHGRFYHPANSRIYFYGDDDPSKRLQLLDEYLHEFEPLPEQYTQASKIVYQPKLSKPWYYTEDFPAGEDSKGKHMVSVNWLINDKPMSPKENLALGVLDDLLVGTSASTLRKALTDSGLGESVIGGGLSDELLQNTYSIGLKGVAPENVKKVEKLVLDTLAKAAQDGFEPTAIEASMNTAEFSMREFNTGSFPRGLSFMLGALQDWIYDLPPTEGLHFEAPLAELKAELASGKDVFKEMLQDLIVNNGHRCTVEMKPSTTLGAEIEAAEAKKLAEIKKGMTETDLLSIIDSTKELKAAQAAEDSPQAKATLPKLSLKDLDKKAKEIPIAFDEVDGVKLITHDLPSSGILYADVGIDMSAVGIEDYPLLGLFTRMLKETGTSKLDRVELSRAIGAQTGGITIQSMISQGYDGGKVADPMDLRSYLFVRGKAVSSKLPQLFDLIHQILADANLDSQQRAIEMLKESCAQFEASLVSSGHVYAGQRLDSKFTLENYIGEVAGGVAFLPTLRGFIKEAESDWPSMLARLERIRFVSVSDVICLTALLSKDKFFVNLTGDKPVMDAAKAPIRELLAKLPTTGSSMERKLPSLDTLPAPAEEGFAVPTQVNYVAKGGRLYEPGEHVPGSAGVASRYLRSGYLWDNVRVMGGAYGGFCRLSPTSGLFSYLSYRDPNLEKTISIYDGAAEYMRNVEITDEDLEMGIIGSIGEMDAPKSVDQKGFTSLKQYLLGQNAADRQRYRDEVLATNTGKEFSWWTWSFAFEASSLVHLPYFTLTLLCFKGPYAQHPALLRNLISLVPSRPRVA